MLPGGVYRMLDACPRPWCQLLLLTANGLNLGGGHYTLLYVNVPGTLPARFLGAA